MRCVSGKFKPRVVIHGNVVIRLVGIGQVTRWTRRKEDNSMIFPDALASGND